MCRFTFGSYFHKIAAWVAPAPHVLAMLVGMSLLGFGFNGAVAMESETQLALSEDIELTSALAQATQSEQALWFAVHEESLEGFPAPLLGRLEALLLQMKAIRGALANDSSAWSKLKPVKLRGQINQYMELSTKVLALWAYAQVNGFSSLRELTSPWLLALPLEVFLQIFPELRWVPDSLEVERAEAKDNGGVAIGLRPSRAKVLGALLKLRSTGPSQASYLKLVKCFLGMTHLANLAEVYSIQGLVAANQPLVVQDSRDQATLCQATSAFELLEISKWSSAKLESELNFRQKLADTFPTPKDLLNEQEKGWINTTSVRWAGLTQDPLSVEDVLPILLLDDGVFNFWELSVKSSESGLKDPTSLFRIRGALLENARRFLSGTRDSNLIDFHNTMMESGVGNLLLNGFIEKARALGESFSYSAIEWSRRMAWIESLTFASYLKAELINWPIWLLEQNAESLQQEVPSLLKKAKERQMMDIFQLVYNYLDLRDGDSIAEDPASDYGQLRDVLLPRLERYLRRDKVQARLVALAESWSGPLPWARLKQDAIQAMQASLIERLTEASQSIETYLRVDQAAQWPYQPEILSAVLHDQMTALGPRMQTYRTWIQGTGSYGEQTQRYREVGAWIRQQAAALGRSELEPCGASGLYRWLGVNKASNPMSAKQKQEAALWNQDYCAWEKLGRWFGYSAMTARPVRLGDLLPGLSQDLVNQELSAFKQHYGEWLKVVELSRYPVLGAQPPELLALQKFQVQPSKVAESKLSLYQILARRDEHRTDGVDRGAPWQISQRALSLALSTNATNIAAELRRIEGAESIEDLSTYVLGNRALNVLFGEESLKDHKEQLLFDQNYDRKGEDFAALPATPALLKFHQETQRQLHIGENLSADLYDQYFEAAGSGVWPILGFWLAQRLLPPGLGSVLKTFSLYTRGAVNSYWLYLTGSFAVDGGMMLLGRAPEIRETQNELRQLNQTQVLGERTGVLDAYSFYQLMNYEEAYWDQTTTRGWWSAGAAALPFVGFWPAAKFYHGILRPWRLAKVEARLQKAEAAHFTANNTSAVSYQVRWFNKWQKYWQRQLRMHDSEFKSLGISEPTWDPRILESAYTGTKIVGTPEQKRLAESAYRNLLEAMAREIWAIRELPASRDLMARAMFGERSQVELLDEVLIKYSELIAGVRAAVK